MKVEFKGKRYVSINTASGWAVMAFLYGLAMGIVSMALHVAGGK